MTSGIKLENVYISVVKDWIEQLPYSTTRDYLFGGDRIDCCTEGVILRLNNKIVCASTISPLGLWESGSPSIMAIYTLPSYRKKGFGKLVLHRTIERCKEKGFRNVYMEISAISLLKIYTDLPYNLKIVLNPLMDFHGMDMFMDED